MDTIIPSYTDMPLYEYYFEPVNNEGVVFLQFMHYDFDKGLKAKKQIEWLFFLTQLFFYTIFITVVYLLITMKSSVKYVFLVLFIILYMTRLLNPMYANYGWYKAYRQMFAGNDTMTTPEEFEERMRKNDIEQLE